MKNPGVLGRLCLGKKQTSQAPVVPLESVPEAGPLPVPIVELSEDPEEPLLNAGKRRRSIESLVPAYAGRPIATVPISEHPPLPEELSAPSAAYLEARTIAHAETSRVRSFFVRDPENVTRVRRTNPNCQPMVLDFLAGNLPWEACDVPHYVNWALHNLPKSWTTDLDEVARRRSPDVAQALFTVALQTTMMAAQVARDYEERPSMARLQAYLEAAKKRNAELADKLVALEKNSAEAVKEVERMKVELVEAR
ncbi:hypothetical protein OROMI_026316 [Orobanche minor]